MKKAIISLVVILGMSCLTACDTVPKEQKINTLTVTEVNDLIQKPKYFPVSVSTMEEDDEKLLVKNYEIDSNVSPYDLVEESFNRGKYQYEVRDILKKEKETEIQTKLASTQIVINSSSKDINKILKQAPAIIEYDKDGYKGQLLLNTSNLYTESLGTKSYSYTVSDTKTYTDLSRNDTSYIAKTITKNGRELSLVDIDWQTTGTTLVGSTLVPSSYTAVAYYSGTAYGSKSTGYATTLTYIGEVSKEIDNGSIVSIIYSGKRVYNFMWLWIVIGLLGISTITVLMLKAVKQKETKEENNDIVEERTEDAVSGDTLEKETKITKEKIKTKKEKVKVYVPKEESGESNAEQT